jgi:hypothetical protein
MIASSFQTIVVLDTHILAHIHEKRKRVEGTFEKLYAESAKQGFPARRYTLSFRGIG